MTPEQTRVRAMEVQARALVDALALLLVRRRGWEYPAPVDVWAAHEVLYAFAVGRVRAAFRRYTSAERQCWDMVELVCRASHRRRAAAKANTDRLREELRAARERLRSESEAVDDALIGVMAAALVREDAIRPPRRALEVSGYVDTDARAGATNRSLPASAG